MRISDWSSDVCSSDLLLDSLVDGAKHVYHRVQVLINLQTISMDDIRGHILERFGWPTREPVDGATVDQRRKHPQALPECFAHRRHAQADVDIAPNSRDVLSEHIQLGRLNSLLLAIETASGEYAFDVFRRVEVGEICCRSEA